MADPLPDYPHKPLPFAEAIAWAKARRVVLPDVYYGPLQGLARSMAFSVAGLTKLSQLELVMKSLEAATADGQSFAAWKKRVEGGEINLDLPAYRVENIFRTNLQGHYNRGRCEQQKENAENQPYLMYDATNDSRARPSHAAMDGFVAPIDDPTWNVWRTPCGYNCRCRTIALSPRQAERFRKADESRMGRDRDAFDDRMESLTGGPDKGWDYDLCAKPTEGLRRAWASHVGKSHPLLKGVTEAAKVATEVQAAAIAAGQQSITRGLEMARQDVVEFGRANNRERLILIDEVNGQELWKADGGANFVSFDDDAIRMMNDPENSIRLIHNHPSDYSLSATDFLATIAPGVSSIEAIGGKGSTYVGRSILLDRDGLKKKLSEIWNAIQHTFQSAILDGKIRAESAQNLHNHALNSAAEKAGLIEYRAVLNAEKTAMLEDENMSKAFDRAIRKAVREVKRSD